MAYQNQCLKEYTCFEYQNLIRGNYKPVKSLAEPLRFKGNTPCIFHDLKYEIVDNLHPDGQEKMYICKWAIQIGNLTHLYFFDFRVGHLNKITMSAQPKFINIVATHIYIVGGSDLFVLSLDTLQLVKTYALGMNVIHAVEPAFKQSDLNSRGVAVYSWNQRQGYTKRYFNNTESYEQKWWTGLTNTILLKKAPQELIGSELKIIIPNVLGLVIMSNMEEICLVNLSSMQAVPHCSRKLSGWTFSKTSRAIIKFYVNKSSQSFDDSLLISVGEKHRQMIEVFVFHIKYTPQIASKVRKIKQSSQAEQVGLPSMTNGEVVDWNSSILENFFTYSTDGGLIDYLLVEKGLIFYSATNSKIPISGFINYYSHLVFNPILTLEHNICQSFIFDSDLVNNLLELRKKKQSEGDNYQQTQLIANCEEQLMNSALRPNRYSLNFLYATIGEESVTQLQVKDLNPKQLFFNWHKLYKIRRLVKFNGDILVLRQNSITSFLSIDSKQFASEFECGENLLKYFQSSDRNSLLSFDLSINESNYSFHLPALLDNDPSDLAWKEINDYQNVAFTYEKQGTFNDIEPVYNIGSVAADYSRNYQKYLSIFLDKISKVYTQSSENIFETQEITLKSQTLSKMIIQNRVKDILLFYSKILRYLFAKTRDYHSHYSSGGLNLKSLEKLLLNYLTGITKLINEPLHQVCAHGADLVQIFVSQEIRALFQTISQQRGSDCDSTVFINVQKESWKIVSKMFEQVIIVNPKSTQVNSFIKLLLNNIKSGFEYIQSILEQIFSPYSTFLLEDQASTHNRLSSFFNPRDQKTLHSSQEFRYPPTSTLLSIYCFLPISEDIQDKLISFCILPTLLSQGNAKSVNQLLSEVIGSKSFKDRVRSLYNQSREACRKTSELKMGTERSERGYSLRQQGDEPDEVSEIDSSLGIIQLAKLLQPDTLQKNLSKLKDEELESVFRVNVETLLAGSERQEQPKYSNEQILIGWVFKYRAYVNRYRQLLSQIKSMKEEAKMKTTNNRLKRRAEIYGTYCLNCLDNIKTYYQKLQPSPKSAWPQGAMPQSFGSSFSSDSDWEIIDKICCRMIGYASNEGLLLYSNQQKVYPDQDYFGLVLQILKDTQSFAQSITTMDSIVFYYLLQIAQQSKQTDAEKKVAQLKLIGKYRSRRQLSEFIMKNGLLRSSFERIQEEYLVRELRAFLPYCEEMGLVIGTMPTWRLRSGQHRPIGVSREDKSQCMPFQMPFRNSYLEAAGR